MDTGLEQTRFRAIDVWKRIDQRSAVRYRCFQLQNNRYCVQSADFYRLPLDARQAQALDQQFLELLIEQSPEERSSTYETLDEAILRHEAELGNA